MLNRDPPDHTRLRRLVSKAFTPRMVDGMRPLVQHLVDEALDQVQRADEVELISSLAFPLPFAVISELLGMPPTDTERLREWSGALVSGLEPVPDADALQRIGEARRNLRELVSEVISWKRANPADDLLSRLIAAEEHGEVLSDDELIAQVILLYVAGHETTVNLIGNGVLALTRHPHQLETLRRDSALDVLAVEELLRYDSPVHMSRRVTLRDVVIGERLIPKGAFVALVLASANRDPARWGESADELDLRREDSAQHVSFGGGPHFCLGAALARLEGQIAIMSVVRRFPRLRLSGEPEWNGRLNLRGLTSLPLSV